jgi:hypothetical protein
MHRLLVLTLAQAYDLAQPQLDGEQLICYGYLYCGAFSGIQTLCIGHLFIAAELFGYA